MTKSRALPEHSKKVIAGIKREIGDEGPSEPAKKKRRERKGPNPLSCLKKKPRSQPQSSSGKRTRKRRRGHKTDSSSGDLSSLIKKVTSN